MSDMSDPDFSRLPEDKDVDAAANDALRQAEEFLRGKVEEVEGVKADACTQIPPVVYRITYYGGANAISSNPPYPAVVEAQWMDYVPGFVVFHTPTGGTVAIASADIMMIEGDRS